MKNTAKTAMRIQAERNPFREEIPEEARRTEALKAKKRAGRSQKEPENQKASEN